MHAADISYGTRPKNSILEELRPRLSEPPAQKRVFVRGVQNQRGHCMHVTRSGQTFSSLLGAASCSPGCLLSRCKI